jgi:hypothetical protein
MASNTTTATVSFKPEDYSRFLIREFLKKNGFVLTYDQFMLEDTSERASMTMKQLTQLLGIEQLMKRNSKSKTFQTMLDIICDFFMISKDANGGVTLPAENNHIEEDSAALPKASHKKAGSIVKKPAV